MPVLATLLDLVPFGVFIVKPKGEILLSNCSADMILAEGTTLAARNGKLAATSQAHEKALTEAVAQAGRDPLSRPSAFSVARPGHPPMSIVIAPATTRTGTSHTGVRKVFVLISDPLHDLSVDPGILAAMFDFTPAEAAVAVHMVEGKDIKHVARDLGVSAHTVRNHLKRLFSKTNTKKQCELLYTLLRSPAALRLQKPIGRVGGAD